METIIDIFFRRIISRAIGLNVRYLFFIIIGQKVDKKELSGKSECNEDNYFSHDFLNAFFGLIFFIVISLIINYLLFLIGGI